MIARAVLRVWVLAALAFGGTGVAQAETFNFSYMSNGVSVMGTFLTNSQANGSYLITSIVNGFRDGNAITLLAPGMLGGNDNLLFLPPSSAYFDGLGVAYSVAGTNENYNPYFQQGDGYMEFTGASSRLAISNLTVEQVPAPLPGGGLLSFIALGLAALSYGLKTIIRRVRLALAKLRPQAAVTA